MTAFLNLSCAIRYYIGLKKALLSAVVIFASKCVTSEAFCGIVLKEKIMEKCLCSSL